MAKTDKKKIEVTINNTWGACKNPLFEKMAKKCDITSDRVKDICGTVVKINGYAHATIKTEDNEFDIHYYSTDNGIISTGSDVFHDSVIDYIDEIDTFVIKSVKTRKGTTYKAVPLLNDFETSPTEE